MIKDATVRWLEEQAAFNLNYAAECERRQAQGRPFVDHDECVDASRHEAGMLISAINHLNGVSPE